jgi:MtrB/PioB family decaheme-associated outer membrane protein
MKVKIMMIVLMVSLAPLFSAFPQDKVVEGELSLKPIWVSVDGREGGEAKFTEYRDLREDGGFYGRARLNVDTEKYFLDLKAGDFGYDTQYYKIGGGLWGIFKGDLFYNEIPHNITFDARSTFVGAGHDTLIGTPNTNVAGWETFDYSVERRQYGGNLKVDVIRPFFAGLSFQREERDGIKPTGASDDALGPGTAFELPEPVHYVTNNLKVEAGYAKKPLFLSVGYIRSDFNNSDTKLNLPANFTGPRAFSLPPDNTYQKGAFKGAVRLPFNSRFSTNIGFSTGESDTSIFSNFDGKVDTQNYDFALTSNPVRFLDAKAYYKFYKRNNKSDPSQNPFSLEVANLFLDYEISTLGGDLGLRLPLNFYLSGGYKYITTKRDKGETDPAEVFPFNTDNVYFGNIKWSGLEFLDAKVGYEHFDRNANYRTVQSEVSPAKRYPYAAQNKDTYKATVDIFPLENLNLGLEYRYKQIDYPSSDTTFGLRKDKRHEVGTSVDYIIGKIAKVYGCGDFGSIKFDQKQSSGGLPWEAEQKERSWGYAIGTEVYIIPSKLTLIFQHDYLKSNGNVDYTLASGLFGAGGLPVFPTANNGNIDIARWDDYTLYAFKIKAVYNFTKSLVASIGYVYQRFDYRDAQLDDYNFAPAGPPASNAAFLTGAYKDQSYKANLVFAGLTFRY